MNRQKYEIKLTTEERKHLQTLLHKERLPEKTLKRAKALLALDNGAQAPDGKKRTTLRRLAEGCGLSATTVLKISKQYTEHGLQDTLTRKKRKTPPKKPIITAEVEQRILTLVNSEPPAGYHRWTLHLLEMKVVELGIVPHISDSTLSRMFKKLRNEQTCS